MFIECEVLHIKTNKIYIFNFELHPYNPSYNVFQDLEDPLGFLGCYEKVVENE